MSTGWYLIFTKPRLENIAVTNLTNQGFHIYFPLMQQHKRIRNIYKKVIEPLFPRYLFIQLNSELDDWSKIRSTRGCISLVRFGQYPARVPDNLIEHLKLSEKNRLINNEITPDFKPGDKVRILDGILGGYEGIIESKNSQQRITLLLKISETHTRSINLSVNDVKKVS